MLGENKNIKDPISGTSLALRDNVAHSITYTKTNKLITALFMVTDIMDKDEPMRNKLRFLGTNILSDTYLNPADSDKKISEVLALLDISKEVRMMSEMNANILKKEFEDLQKSVRVFSPQRGPVWLEEFLKEEVDSHQTGVSFVEPKLPASSRQGHTSPTRIGVQKGSTLLNALKGVAMSDKSHAAHLSKKTSASVADIHSNTFNYEVLRTKRREEIIAIIKNKLSVLPDSGGATITDIKNSAEGPLASCGEKTLQRELISMVHDGVLYKTGEKRWSKYSIKRT